MKDEEKAEEYANTHCCYKRQDFIRAYLDGLAEGRKEGYEQGKNNEREFQCGKKNYEKDISKLEKENAKLKEQNEKMKSFIHSEIDFCMYCPLTETCKNDEGTCPYAGISEDEQKKLLTDWVTKLEIENE